MQTRHLRNFAVAAALGWGFFWPFHFAQNSPFWERLMDAVHLPVFFGVAWWLHFMLARDGRMFLRACKIAGITIGVAAAVEWIQPLTGRSESLVDFRNGFFGALTGGLAIYFREEKKSWHWGGLLVMAAAGFALVALWPTWQEWEGIRWRQQEFPLLGDFENPVELRLWSAQGGSSNSVTVISLAPHHATRGVRALEVATGRGSWAGVSYAAGDRDWSTRRKLVADFYNPGDVFTLGVRVDDDGDCRQYGQRFDRELQVMAGSNRMEIAMAELEQGPHGRKLNLRAIRRLVFFTLSDQPERTFFLDNVRLE